MSQDQVELTDLGQVAAAEIESCGDATPKTDDKSPTQPAVSKNATGSDGKSWDLNSESYAKQKKVGPVLTAFLILNTMIGAGILDVPYTFRQSGIILGMLIFVAFALLTWFSLIVLIKAAAAKNTYDYGAVSRLALGKWGEYVVDIFTVLEGFGGCLGYLVIMGSQLHVLAKQWSGQNQWYTSYHFMTALVMLVGILPLSLIKQFGHFAWISVLSIASIGGVVLLVMFHGPAMGSAALEELQMLRANVTERTGAMSETQYAEFWGDPDSPQRDQDTDESELIYASAGVFAALGAATFALGCQTAALHAYRTMKDPTPDKWFWVSGAGVAVGALLCLVTGLAGYLSFRGLVQGEILDSFPSSDVPAAVFRVMLVIHLIFYYPVHFAVLRHSLAKLFKMDIIEMHCKWFILFTILPNLVCFAIVMVTQNFSIIIQLTGAICGTLLYFIIPGTLYLRAVDRPTTWVTYSARKGLCLWFGSVAMIVIAFAVMMVCTIVTIYCAVSSWDQCD